jgi:histidine triad (HIT) family protein
MTDCLFCKIVKKEAPSDIVYEDDSFIAFKDINPKAEVHLLIVPKKHIASIKEIEEEDKELIGGLFLIAKKLAQERELKGYKLIFNVGREGGQIIDHIHLHLLGGKFRSLP